MSERGSEWGTQWVGVWGLQSGWQGCCACLLVCLTAWAAPQQTPPAAGRQCLQLLTHSTACSCRRLHSDAAPPPPPHPALPCLAPSCRSHGQPVPRRGDRHSEAPHRVGVWLLLLHQRPGRRADLRRHRHGRRLLPLPPVRQRARALRLLLLPPHQHQLPRRGGPHVAPRPPRPVLRLRRPHQVHQRHPQRGPHLQLQDPRR